MEVILEFFDLEHLLYTLQQKFIDDNNPHGLNPQKWLKNLSKLEDFL